MRIWTVVLSSPDMFHLADYLLAFDYLAKYNVFPVKMVKTGTANKKLTAVCVGPGIGHGD